jgi:hypothetical protein
MPKYCFALGVIAEVVKRYIFYLRNELQNFSARFANFCRLLSAMLVGQIIRSQKLRIWLDHSVIALWLGYEFVETIHMYLYADMRASFLTTCSDIF